MGSNWVLSAPDGPHVGPVNLAIREADHPNLTMTSSYGNAFQVSIELGLREGIHWWPVNYPYKQRSSNSELWLLWVFIWSKYRAVMKNTMYIENCLEFDTIIPTLSYITKNYRVLLKRGCFIEPQNQRFRLKKVVWFFRPDFAKRVCFPNLGTSMDEHTREWGWEFLHCQTGQTVEQTPK